MLGAFAAAVVVAAAATLSGSVAQGRVDPSTEQRAATQLSLDTIAIATGGGTIESDPTTIASFGLNGKRPAGFNPPGTNGAAQGRINYDKHAQIPGGRHVNAPVTFMTAEIANPQTGNQTGGKAELIGDCQAPGAECPSSPPGIKSVLVHVEDNSDSGAGMDVFRILYCTTTASQTVISPACVPDADMLLRTGNIQIRTNVSGSGGNAPTSARAPIRLP
jgi:hypothetical protein